MFANNTENGREQMCKRSQSNERTIAVICRNDPTTGRNVSKNVPNVHARYSRLTFRQLLA